MQVQHIKNLSGLVASVILLIVIDSAIIFLLDADNTGGVLKALALLFGPLVGLVNYYLYPNSASILESANYSMFVTEVIQVICLFVASAIYLF